MPKLTAGEIEELLNQRRYLHLATTANDASPSLVPLGFIYKERTIYLTARARAQWLADIRRDPRVCICIDDVPYPHTKITIRNRAEIVYEPGHEDDWRDLRLPQPTPAWTGGTRLTDGTVEWDWNEAYNIMTWNEPRALVAVSVASAKTTSWRLPLVGEYLEEAWSGKYYQSVPRRFRVSRLGPSPDGMRVVSD